MEKKNSKSANAYNIVRTLLYIILVGVTIRFLYDGFGMYSGSSYRNTAIGMVLLSALIIFVLEGLLFSKWRRKLDTFAAITQGSMYQRTVGGYPSANDRAAGDHETEAKDRETL